MKRILVCGSRNFNDEKLIVRAFTIHGENGTENLIIHGGCKGADQIAGSVALRNSWWVTECPARWERGKKAGPIRNQAMLDEFHPDIVLAFPIGESKGTRGMIKLAERAGIPVEVFE